MAFTLSKTTPYGSDLNAHSNSILPSANWCSSPEREQTHYPRHHCTWVGLYWVQYAVTNTWE